MDCTAAHCDGYSPRCSCTNRTARSRTSGENLLFLLMAPFSQKLEPPQNSVRFILIEQPAIELFAELGWETANLYGEWSGSTSTAGRQTPQDVVLESRLRAALTKLNPTIAGDAIDKAIEELTRSRSTLLPVNANDEVYWLLKDGVKVEVVDEDGHSAIETVKVIDWNQPHRNHFLLASQFWVKGELHTRRTDLIGFINGLPLLFIELKASHTTLKAAYDANLSD